MRVAVLGMGLSGLAALKLSLINNYETIVIDKKKFSELSEEVRQTINQKVLFFEESKSSKILKDIDILVVSPGVPKDNKVILKAKHLNKKIISEIEFGYINCNGKIIAVSGSNGKTTTTSMMFSIFKSHFEDVRLGGNIGIPFSEIVVNSNKETIFILELSSFQLEYIETFAPYTSVLLNLTPDHQDRYKRFGDYCKAKMNIFKNQTRNDFAVINRFDEALKRYEPFIKAKKFFFSSSPHKCKGAFRKGNAVFFRKTSKESEILFEITDLKVKGPHNLENAMAAASAAYLNGVPSEKIRNSLTSFSPLPHRLEFVATINGADFYNDSKATNTDSVKKALLSFEKNVTLLLGGKDKGAHFVDLEKEILKRCKKVVCFGAARNKVLKIFKGKIRTECFNTLKEAVKNQIKIAERGEIVLLSPACASFDEFRNYEERGEKFKEWVLKGKK